MNPSLPGIHHVTAITEDAQKNIDFYAGILGLRFVKKTVNFDDPSSYHLYYGDEHGRPGTAMTFFVWPRGRAGRVGPPQVTTTQFAVPVAALDFWKERLEKHAISTTQIENRFGDSGLAFLDPDQMPLELIGLEAPGGAPPERGPVPSEMAIRGFHGVTLSETKPQKTEALLENVMGFKKEHAANGRTRFRAANTSLGSVVDVLLTPPSSRGMMGVGVVHHVAFRTPDDPQQKLWQSIIRERGFDISPVMDRCYFHSIYFREPGGVLFEIATDGPGFTFDEPLASLGAELKLPPWMESQRTEIEHILPNVTIPEWI